ncbi:MAG: branched-chain amino acid ABC transporter ATP-binding protein [Spirochaetes bacterium]|nr:MAG: branched-chain amino acid ABC transporter ATP-binding protein [Spirochaetota bacterium]RKX86034.1 MAG: branched-chain amino acid ABC transporter ATP-binding protein [Spirochaetota bacterium]RKX98871.1 MAG: branched-chain amino acid ABC transporter ATP-binding protein [Spirochaetota bacterium]
MIRIRNLEAGYDKLKVLKGISLHVNSGEIVTIIGANGAGKSTLLNTIASLITPSSGEILLQGKDVTLAPPDRIVKGGCVLVPEGRQLFPTMTVKENLILGAYTLFGRKKSNDANRNLEQIYKMFPILNDRQSQLAGTLSGGEQQMVALGRGLMSNPNLIMMDEPSMGLAPLIVKDIFKVVETLRDQGKTVLIVEQNAKAVLGIADRGYVMETGSLVLEGSAEELLDNNDVRRAYLGKDYKEFTDMGGRE